MTPVDMLQSDHLLFFIAAGVMLVGIGFVWRWLISDRKELCRRLTEVTDRHIATLEKFGKVVANNNLALDRISTLIEYCKAKNQTSFMPFSNKPTHNQD